MKELTDRERTPRLTLGFVYAAMTYVKDGNVIKNMNRINEEDYQLEVDNYNNIVIEDENSFAIYCPPECVDHYEKVIKNLGSMYPDGYGQKITIYTRKEYN